MKKSILIICLLYGGLSFSQSNGVSSDILSKYWKMRIDSLKKGVGINVFLQDTITYGVFAAPFKSNHSYNVISSSGLIQYAYMNQVVGYDDPADHENVIASYHSLTGEGAGISAGWDTTGHGFFATGFYDSPSGNTYEWWLSKRMAFGVQVIKNSIAMNSVVFFVDTNGYTNIVDGTQGQGKVFTSDAKGKGTWQPATASGSAGNEPISPYPGQFYFNTSTTKMEFWNGSSWVALKSTPINSAKKTKP